MQFTNKSDDDSDDCSTAEGNKGSTSDATLSKSSELPDHFCNFSISFSYGKWHSRSPMLQ